MTTPDNIPQSQNEPRSTNPTDISQQSDETITHVLRSNYQYIHNERYIPRQLSKAFNYTYGYFKNRNPIPQDIMAKLSDYIIDAETFHHLVTNMRSESAKYVYLEDGRIRFDEYTLPPHSEVIEEVICQIRVQNWNW